MTDLFTNQTYLTTKAYATDELLDIRIRTHELYTVPKPVRDFADTVLDLATWRGDETVLDIGCGAGSYLHPVLKRLSEGGILLGGDLSAGMLAETARKKGFHQADRPTNFNLLNTNAMSIPLPNGTCDIVLANHMLYHVPDLPRTLAEIQRVLKPGGTLLAATNHPDSMQEMRDQVEIACQLLGHPLEIASPIQDGFNLENGAAALRPFFANVQVYTFESALVFPTPKPAIDYINSARHYYARFLPAGLDWSAVLDQLKYTIGARIAGGGAFRVPKTSGVFVAWKADV